MRSQFNSGLSLKRENVMKEKKVGDVIVFDYDVYDIEYNVEEVYDHTDTLKGVVEEVIPDSRHTRYRVKLTGVVNAENPNTYTDYIGTNFWIATDDKVYRGGALFNLSYPNLHRPTVEQVRRIQSYGNKSPESIVKDWYRDILGDAYDGNEFLGS